MTEVDQALADLQERTARAAEARRAFEEAHTITARDAHLAAQRAMQSSHARLEYIRAERDRIRQAMYR